MTLSFSVAAEVFSDPVTMPNEPSRKVKKAVLRQPIKAPDSQADSSIFSTSMRQTAKLVLPLPLKWNLPPPCHSPPSPAEMLK